MRLTEPKNITIWIVALLFLSKSKLWLLGNVAVFLPLAR